MPVYMVEGWKMAWKFFGLCRLLPNYKRSQNCWLFVFNAISGASNSNNNITDDDGDDFVDYKNMQSSWKMTSKTNSFIQKRLLHKKLQCCS